MSPSIEILEAEALKLTAAERAELADRLLASLSDRPGVDNAWADEAERRIAEIEAGRVPLIPSGDAIARARDALM
ncbi:MAG: addiction module protein [Chloroflexota bacterium]